EPALEPLRQAMKSDDSEVRRRARLVVAIIEKRLFGEELCLKGHVGAVWRGAVAPDGRHFLTCGEDKTVRLWDARTGKEELRFTRHREAVGCCAVSPDN